MKLKQEWKTREYQSASFFRGRRRAMRKWHKQGPDVRTECAEIEIKSRKKLPGWLTDPLNKCKAFNPAKIAVVLWIQENQNLEDGIVLLSAADLKILLTAYQASSSVQP